MLLIFILLPNKNLFSQDEKKSSKPDSKTKTKSFASIISEATKDDGLFNVYFKDDKYYFDLPKLAKHKLSSLGISEIFDSKIDTFKNIKYFSYRRSIHLKHRDYGRNLSLVSII